MRRSLVLLALLGAAGAAAAQGVDKGPVQALPGTAGPLLPRDSEEAARFRGSLVFFNYCVTCHGPNADGQGRAARLYDPPPANLRRSDKNPQYMQMIVRMGGKAVGRSEFMPPWGEELTDEQIGDVVAYLQSINVRFVRPAVLRRQ